MNTKADIIAHIPRDFVLKGRHIELSMLARMHHDSLIRFAQALPPNDLLFLRRDIAKPTVIDNWIREDEEGAAITIVACDGSDIVGFASFDRGRMPWSQHVAEIQVVVAESVRGLGVGRLLLEMAFEISLAAGVLKVVARMTPNQTQAIKLFRELGFEQEATLHDHAVGTDGCLHDLLVFSYLARQHQDHRCQGCATTVLTGLTLDGANLCPLCFQARYEELGGGD
jgi:L-amino acid N-acyltransferase YncA